MRAILRTAALTVAVLVLTAVPALATEGGSGEAGTEAAAGGFDGVLLGMILGVIFGTVVVLGAYRSAFGSERGHQADAHDLREGFGSHEPGQDDVPQTTSPPAEG